MIATKERHVRIVTLFLIRQDLKYTDMGISYRGSQPRENRVLEKLAQLQKDLEELARRIELFKKLLENAARK